MKLTILSISVVILGLASVIWAYLPGSVAKLEYELYIEGKLDQKQTKWISSNGDYRIEAYYYDDGKVTGPNVTIGIGDKGVFTIGKDRMFFLSEKSHAKRNFNLDLYKNSDAFKGEEIIAGLKTVKIENKQGAFWLASEFDGIEAKRVTPEHTFELKSVTYNVQQKIELPDLPIDCSSFQQKVELDPRYKEFSGPCK